MANHALSLLLLTWVLTLSTAAQARTDASKTGSWMDEAIIYGIAPTFISDNEGKKLKDIEARLPEIKELGANTIWLMPIYQSDEGEEGYDVTDYFKVHPELGSEEDLKSLVDQAHNLDLKVLFDFVPNHLSVRHPFVKDVLVKGTASPYYEMFMTKKDLAPYSNFYQWADFGSVKFIVYFWNELINLDFSSSAAQKHIRDAATYWVKNFSIDGYRFDAAWGPVARNPKFLIELRDELKKINPELMILAEDKASEPTNYVGSDLPFSAQLFDAVYDWTASANYVSEWSWTQDQHSLLKLNSKEDVAGRLRTVLKRSGNPEELKARVLRFIENNDLERFILKHTLEETKLASALTFTLPGIPLIFYGQEVGYGTVGTKKIDHYPTFQTGEKIRSRNKNNLWEHYQALAQMRAQYEELSRGSFTELVVSPESASNQVYAFERRNKDNVFRVVANLDESPVYYQLPGQLTRSRLKGNEILFFRNGVRLNLSNFSNR